MPLVLQSTLDRQPRPFVPRDPAHVTFYTCGPTVYDDAHIGNFRSFLAADLLRRFLESPLCEVTLRDGSVHAGPRTVTHVMNITDVGHMTEDDVADGAGEDKMAAAGRRLAEAKKAGKLPAGVDVNPSDPFAVARFYEARFKEDAVRLGLKLAIEAQRDATLMPRATENVAGMIEAIARLIERRCAYIVGEPGARVVYFDVQAFPAYGRLSGNTLDNLREGEGGRISAANQAGKKHPADFLLWKEDPTHIMKWESPWGAGYPGWHIECTAMSIARLTSPPAPGAFIPTDVAYPGAVLDLHSGGEDNIFPHHECEIAQSCCAYTASTLSGQFSRVWFHPRFLLVEGAKMSKSKGNFFTPRELFAKGVEPAALRLELIRTHYRSNANFTMQGLTDGQRIIDRWRRVLDDYTAGDEPSPGAKAALAAFADAMHDDLNVAGAIAAVNSWLNTITKPTREDQAALRTIDAVLGVLGLERPKATTTGIGVYAPGVEPSPEIEALLALRRDARAARDFATSDAIRDQLAQRGLAIKDGPGGSVEVRRS
ncbi:MAG: cysteine--tRNA ligase [Phycisphaerales bacterium]|nr:cysteine--tRNA ligase [Phycisphaerales bacterium]